MLATGVFATTPVAYASTSQITLSVLSVSAQPNNSALQWLTKQYEKADPQVTFSIDLVSNSLQKVTADAATHSLPDLYYSDPTSLPDIMPTGDWVDLKPVLTKWGQMNDYLPATWAQAEYNGGIYAIPDGLNDLGFIYNKTIFAEAGITTTPTTWSQLLSDGKTLVAKVKGLTYGAVGVGAETLCASNWEFLPFIYQQGLDVNDLASPGMAAAINFWNTMLKDGVANKEIITECQNDLTQVMDGKLAMMEDGQWDLLTMAQDHFKDYGVFPIPVRSPSEHPAGPMGGEYWTVPKTNATAEAAAEKFLLWAQQPSIELQYDLQEDYTPARTSLWGAFEKDVPGAAPWVQELKYGVGRTTALGVKWPAYGNALGTAIVQVLEGQKSTASALAAAASAAKRSLASES
jgi:multiple sugar transport system substrate-binding protein